MTQLSSFQLSLPSPRPSIPTRPVPSHPAGTTQLTPFPSPVKGNYPTTLPHHHPSSCPRLHLSLYPHHRQLCRLSRDTDNSFASPFPPFTYSPLAAHTGAISTTARRDAARCAASPRRDERAKAAQKVPFGRKTSPSFSLLSILHLYETRSLLLSLPASRTPYTSRVSLCLTSLSPSCSFCLGSSFSGPPAILFLSIPWQGRTMQRDPGARIRGG